MFSDNMKKLMRERGITGAALAKQTGFSKAAISQYINGINMPSAERMEAIAEALQCGVEELAGSAAEPMKTSCKCAVQPLYSNRGTITPKQAAALMHKHVDYVRQGLQEGRPGFEFGSAVKTSTKWSYCIYANKFTEITGIPVDGI